MELCWDDVGTRRRMLAVPAVYFLFYMVYFNLLDGAYSGPDFGSPAGLERITYPFCEVFISPLFGVVCAGAGAVPLLPPAGPGAVRLFVPKHSAGADHLSAPLYNFSQRQPLRRPITRDNLLSRMVIQLRAGDTPTNVCPSIHVFVSMTAGAGGGAFPRHGAAVPRPRGTDCPMCSDLYGHSIPEAALPGGRGMRRSPVPGPGRGGTEKSPGDAPAGLDLSGGEKAGKAAAGVLRRLAAVLEGPARQTARGAL